MTDAISGQPWPTHEITYAFGSDLGHGVWTGKTS